ncbi:YhdP family protein [Alteromonas sediminis]|nr:YhdP family protein [Alteromonas sediminis]
MSGVVSYAVKKLWLAAAVLLVSLAVVLSLFRYALPHLDSKKHLVEQYALEHYGVQLRIGQISATWQGSGPSLVLSQVSLSQKEQSPVNLNVDKVWVDINFWQSVSERLLISERFELNNLSLEIDPESMQAGSQQEYPVVDALKNLFLVQLHQFTVTDGQISVRTSNQTQVFDVEQLVWLNDEKRHQGKGRIRVQELANNSASFIIELNGDPEQLSGTLFAKAETLDISPWVNEWVTTQYPLNESRANLSAWVTIDNNNVDHLHIALEDTELKWEGLPESQAITSISGGTVQALPDVNGWTFRVDQLVISQNRKTFVTDLVGQADSQGNAVVNTVKPVSIQPVLGVLPLFMDASLANSLLTLNPDGELSTLQVNWQAQTPSIKAKLIDVGWSESGNIPGFTGMDAEFYWHGQQGKLQVTAADASLDASNLLGRTLADTDFDITAYLYMEPDALVPGWQLSVPESKINTDLITLSLAAHANLATSHLQLSAKVDGLDLVETPSLFPSDYMGKQTVAYLSRAFSGAGKVDSAEIIWSGSPSYFPFSNNEGIFQANVGVSNADFVFSSEWPALSKLDMTLLFENEGLFLQSESGLLGEVTLQNLQARIPRLASSSGIYIAATGAADASSVTSLMQKGGLKASLGKLLSKDVLVQGPLDTDLYLGIPFNGDEVIASGRVGFNEASAKIAALDITAENLQGELTFNNEAIAASQLSAKLFGQAVAIDITGRQTDELYDLFVGVEGHWDVKALLNYAQIPLEDYLYGDANWRTGINVELTQNGFRYQAELASDLKGIDSRLPLPASKDSGQTRALFVDAKGDSTSSEIDVTIEDDIAFTGILSHQSRQFDQILLTAGDSPSGIPIPGFNILANVPKINIDEWSDVISKFTSQTERVTTNNSRLFPLPQRVAIESEVMVFKHHEFSDARVDARQANAQWRIDMVSKQAIAKATIAADIQRDGIDIRAEKLYLQSNDSFAQTPNESQAVQHYFPLRFKCTDCRINEYVLGEVDVELNPNDTGVTIDRLNITHPYASLRATGGWNESDETQIQGEFTSGDFGRWLDSMALNSGIKDSEADVAFSLAWPGQPTAFSLEAVKGQADWSLSDGYLTEVSDKGSRIFTLFSLNSLVRKLSLDFRDVFAQGFFYDDINGSLVLENGNAMTEDTVVDGGAGEIEIRGYANLVSEKLNYDISFTPNVTGNLPFLVYFLANPPTAIAALAIDQVLTSAKVISNVNYQVTGTFEAPVVTEVGRDSKEVTLPAQASPPDESKVPQDSELEVDRVKVEVFDG